MKRLLTGFLITALFVSLGATRAFAAGEPDSKPRFDFSARAAGISAMVKADAARPSHVTASPRTPQATSTKKSFWKTPWPYMIAGGAVIAGVLIAKGGDGNGY